MRGPPDPESPERSGSRLQFSLSGFGRCWRWDMGSFSWRGAGAELGKGKGGFNQLDLIGIKKKYSSQNGEGDLAREALTPRVPQNRLWEASVLLVSIWGDFWILRAQRRFAGGLSHSPYPSKASGRSQNSLKNPNSPAKGKAGAERVKAAPLQHILERKNSLDPV